MLNKIILMSALSFGAMCAAFATRDTTNAGPVRLAPKTIAQLPITRHFSEFVTGGSFSSSANPPLTLAMPAGIGVAITQVTAVEIAGGPINLKINGLVALKLPGSAGSSELTITPALIVPPGAVLTLGVEGAPTGFFSATVSGYMLEQGDFGQ